MAGRDQRERTEFQVLLLIFKTNLLIGLGIFLLCFGGFLWFTGSMDNQFADYARERHKLLAVFANLRTLPGYLILATAYTLLAFPLLRGRRLFRQKGDRRHRRFRLLTQVVTNILLFLISLGYAAFGNPAFLDAASRRLSPTFPDLDLYSLYDLPILKGLQIVLWCLTVWSAILLLRMLLRSTGVVARPLRFLLLIAIIGGGGLATAGFFGGPKPAPVEGGPPHIVVIAADSLRADHLSCYGYSRETSPNIDALADEGVVFDNFNVSTASTLESWTTMMLSKFPVSHGIRYMYPSKDRVKRASGDDNSLPRVLGRAGYHTAVSSNWAGNCFKLIDMGFAANRASDIQNLDVFIAQAALSAHFIYPLYFNNSFGEAICPPMKQITYYLNPAALRERLIEEAEDGVTEGKPFFGLLFESTTHLPYTASYPFNMKWVDRSYRGANRYQIDFTVDTFIKDGFREALTKEEVQHIIDLYDGTVSQFDHNVGEVVAWLKEAGLYDNTIIVITSDHGDDLYEANTTLGHGTNFFGGDQCTRIPLVIRFPKARHAGTRVEQITRTVDLAPTLLDAAGLSSPVSYEGLSLLPTVRAPGTELDLPSFAETCYLFFPKKVPGEEVLTVEGAGSTLTIDPDFDNNLVLREEFHQPVIDTKDRMMRTRRWKLVHIPGVHGPILRLYDMQSDPGQTTDLSMQHPQLVKRMQSHLELYWAGRTDLRWTEADDQPDR